jgi:hypothetical protein
MKSLKFPDNARVVMKEGKREKRGRGKKREEREERER